jgi:hypothetical protein
MMNRADRALYVAKGSGRNCVMVDEQVAKLPRRALGVLGVPQEESALATAGGVALRLIRKRLG